MAILDASFPWVSETFVGPFGLLAYQADGCPARTVRRAARVRYGTTYFLWIEGVLALSGHEGDALLRPVAGIPAAYYTGFTATCRDESRQRAGRHEVPAGRGTEGPRDDQGDPRDAADDPAARRGGSREVIYEPLGWTQDEVRMLMFQQLGRKLNDVGISLPADLQAMVGSMQPVLAAGDRR